MISCRQVGFVVVYLLIELLLGRDIMVIFAIILISLGIAFDLIEFLIRLYQYINGKRIISTTMFFALLLDYIGCALLFKAGYKWFFVVLMAVVLYFLHEFLMVYLLEFIMKACNNRRNN